MRFAIVGERLSPRQRWLADGLDRTLQQRGHTRVEPGDEDLRLVLNFADSDHPRPYRRKAQATYVVTVAQLDERPESILRAGYPILVRSLSNLLILLVNAPDDFDTYFVTLEQGFYRVPHKGHDEDYFARVYQRLEPLATSNLIINNDFHTDLPEELWEGDDITRQVSRAAKQIEAMDLWPAPFPIQEILPPEDLRHVRHLYGIGGLSYGNLSARKDRRRFWMSASGVNKANLRTVGKDILLVKQFDERRKAMQLSVPPHVTPRRVSVDAIEHWMIYTEHPNVGAIVHIHAWIEGIPSTQINYPCGTVELARAVADEVRRAKDPTRAIIGLKNHGMTITGPDLDDIFERIDGKVIPQVPMA
ncbi:class II aldolase/adducin family protein [Alicyclobacillus shizuokensis]|uniref:class II aldolase/adducin family protein n=1 Tax=Alicyclobacillus shizuokensis TaxID=392014 RepID=UPI000832C219|nr:class II aldolase/adducin family protein [Alicyclobacillus shizuokensis]MCL6626833.1 class II aldolase/adducin family protein [Alicyclobacillus shizuokensis]